MISTDLKALLIASHLVCHVIIFHGYVLSGFTHKALEAKIYPKELKEKIASFNELVDEVKELTSAAGSIAEKYFEMTMATSSTYTNIFREVIKEKWTYMLPHSSYDPNLVLPVEISESNYEESDPTAFNEHNSDVCMSNLMGTQEEGEKKPCVITDNCWTMMTRRKVGGYIITHQALYFMLADVRGNRIDMFLISCLLKFFVGLHYRVNKKTRKLFNKPLNNSDIFNFQNLICFWLSTPKLRF